MPTATRSLEALAENWFDQTVLLRLGGAGKLADHPALLNNLRRGFGGALGRGASEAARVGRPCSWSPPCALDVLFREQLRSGGEGLPKPMVVCADRDGGDLLVALRVFGFAAEWLPAAEHAFVVAVREIVPWDKLGASVPEIRERRIETCCGIAPSEPPETVTLQWLTPLDAHKLDLTTAPWSVFTRLLRRVKGLARWCDTELDMDESALEACWGALRYDLGRLETGTVPFWSGRDRKLVRQEAVWGELRISGGIGPLWPLLRIGERAHVGRGAVQGRGRFLLAP